MSTDPLTGLPIEFVRMLAVKVDPYTDNPNKPLDDFFAALMRAQNSFRRTRKTAGTDLDSKSGQGGPFIMTSETQETQNALTVVKDNLPANADGWDAAAADSTASPVKGASIKFIDGAYLIGREKILIKGGTQFVAMDVREGWMFLKKDCPAEYAMRAIGAAKPARPDSFNEQSEWPFKLNSKTERDDPWKYTKFVYLLDPVSAEAFTFASNTTGGRIGISDLTSQITLMRTTRPGAVPIVELESRPFKTGFGMKTRPFFRVIGWRVKADEASKLIANNSTNNLVDSETEVINEFDDDIPY